MIKSFKIFEKSSIIEVGDMVKIKKGYHYLYPELDDAIGDVIHISDDGDYLVRFKNLNSGGLHSGDGLDPTEKSRWFDDTDFILVDNEEVIKRKEERKRRQEEIRLKYKDIDPYGEEDWLEESVSSVSTDFELGDRVEYVGNELIPRLNKNKYGVIIKVWRGGEYGIEFDEKMNGHDCKGNGKWGYCWNVNKYEIIHVDPEKIEEIKRKQEELRLKYKDIDPYGEEDWMTESLETDKIQVNVEDVYEFNDLCKIIEPLGYVWMGGSDEIPNTWIPSRIRSREKTGIVLHTNKKISWTDNLENGISLEHFKIFTKYGNKNLKKIEKPDIDPYNEEDWGYEEVNENVKNEIEKLKIFYSTPEEAVDIAETLRKLGHEVYDFENVRIDANNWECFVLSSKGRFSQADRYYGTGIISYKNITYEYFMYKYGNKNLKKIERPEIDPYGEDDWGYVQENNHYDIDPYGEEDWGEEELLPVGTTIKIVQTRRLTGAYERYIGEKATIIESFERNGNYYYKVSVDLKEGDLYHYIVIPTDFAEVIK